MLHQIDPDSHGPLGATMADAVSTCVHCGFCLAACPTYELLGQEADSPRGRIVLMKSALEGKLPIEKAIAHTDPCLGCLACEPACPSGVPYRDLISPFRAITESKRKRTLMQRIQRWLIQATLPYPNRFRFAAIMGRMSKPFITIIPKALRPMIELVPDKVSAPPRWHEVYPAFGQRKFRVGLLVGCVQNVIDADINQATIDVLVRNGIEVVVPKSQTCCGALSWHVGNLNAAQRFAKANIEAFADDLDWIVTNAAGCGSGIHEYHLILKGTTFEAKAEAFRHRVIDVSVLLSKLDRLEPIPHMNEPLRIAYHEACHLANAQGVRTQPRQLLRMIPGIELLEIPEGHLCCGSAGTYNIDQPDLANQLGQQKVTNILSTKPNLIAMGNIGCMVQISRELQSNGSTIPARHTFQILRDAYAGQLKVES
jgi:glycolate oxidase iron-sulfur subunit